MKKLHSILVVSFLLGMIHAVSGQSLPEPASVIPLYEGVAPGSENWDWEENTAVSYRGLPIVQNVVKPVLMYYPPEQGTIGCDQNLPGLLKDNLGILAREFGCMCLFKKKLFKTNI
jgi:hypothetical protein